MPFKTQHPLYGAWKAMRRRCRNPNSDCWKHYGGRGITVCDRWNSFHAFLDDMGPKPKGYTLERIDNDGNYEPSNCRWATRKEQMRNQSVTRWVTIEGKRYRAVDLSDISGIKTDSIVERATAGLTYEEVISAERRVFTAGLALGGKANGARQKAKTHCPRGHAFNAENTHFTQQGWRACRACHRERARERKSNV